MLVLSLPHFAPKAKIKLFPENFNGIFSLLQMKTSFVQRTGYASAGSNITNLSVKHQSSKTHMNNYTYSYYQLLGNTDVACALDEAKQREVDQHNRNATRYTK